MNEGELNSIIEKICRLCATTQDNGHVLFAVGSEEMDNLVKSICCLLDIEFRNDGELPNWLCSRCQTEAARMEEFIQLVKNGQVKLMELVTIRNDDIKIEDEFIETDQLIKQAPSIEDAEIEIKTETICRNSENINQNHKAECIEQHTKESIEHSKPQRLLEDVQMKVYSESPCNAPSLPENLENEIDSCMFIISRPIAELRTDANQDLGENIQDESNKDMENLCLPKKYFICEYCKEVFPQQQVLLKHIEIHKDYIYECHDCLQTFSNKDCLSQHQTLTGHVRVGIIEDIGDKTEEIHSEKERCRLGDAVATTDFNYVVGANGQITSIDEVDSSAEDGTHITQEWAEKSSVCSPESDVRISYNDCIKKLPKKRFTCDVCPKSFNTKNLLNIHNRVHTGEKPFKCLICLRTFANRGSLVSHSRSHSHIRPYKCLSCASTFKDEYRFEKHTEMLLCSAQRKLTVEQEADTSEVQSPRQTLTRHIGVDIIEDIGAQEEEYVSYDKDLSRLGTVEATAATNIVVDVNDQITPIDEMANSIEEKTEVSQAWAGKTQDSVCPSASNVKISYKNCSKKLSDSHEYACVACQKTYSSHHSVRRHYKKMHDSKQFKCPVCPYTFRVKYQCDLHLGTHSE